MEMIWNASNDHPHRDALSAHFCLLVICLCMCTNTAKITNVSTGVMDWMEEMHRLHPIPLQANIPPVQAILMGWMDRVRSAENYEQLEVGIGLRGYPTTRGFPSLCYVLHDNISTLTCTTPCQPPYLMCEFHASRLLSPEGDHASFDWNSL